MYVHSFIQVENIGVKDTATYKLIVVVVRVIVNTINKANKKSNFF